MMQEIAGWPYWEIQFDKDGHTDAGTRATLLDEISGAGITDLVVMSHGWNSSADQARQLYQRWFGMLPPLIPPASGSKVGTLGVLWPAMLWPDDPVPAALAGAGGAAGLAAAPQDAGSPGAPVAALTNVYPGQDQHQILNELAGLLDAQPSDPSSLSRFHDLMAQLAATEPKNIDPVDEGALGMLDEDPQQLALRFASGLDQADLTVGAPGVPGGAAGTEGGLEMAGGAADLPGMTLADIDKGAAAGGIGDITGRLWNGAKEALRQVTYWMMKRRAGTVGQVGMGPFLGDLHGRASGLRVHLVGHSFGARLVSFSLAGLPPAAPTSPVHSLTLLEGAFSHFAFADRLPFDTTRGGALSGMAARVSGPLLACFSSHDLAVGLFYPLASMASGEDAAGLDDQIQSRWGGIGHDGAQGVGASAVTLGPQSGTYSFPAGRFTNIDASAIVCHGDSPSGAHSDIFHPELAWAMLTAAALV
jgi:hypothetical protein